MRQRPIPRPRALEPAVINFRASKDETDERRRGTRHPAGLPSGAEPPRAHVALRADHVHPVQHAPRAAADRPAGERHADGMTLRQTGLFDDMARKTDEAEHSLEMHLPYLHSVMQGQRFELVPVLVGALSEVRK